MILKIYLTYEKIVKITVFKTDQHNTHKVNHVPIRFKIHLTIVKTLVPATLIPKLLN